MEVTTEIKETLTDRIEIRNQTLGSLLKDNPLFRLLQHVNKRGKEGWLLQKMYDDRDIVSQSDIFQLEFKKK